MHIPDGWLDPAFILLTWTGTLLMMAISLQKLRNIEGDRLSRMAILGGVIFAAQMLNFPIVGGTSGHFLGGALATLIVGPWAAFLVMAVVLLMQALLFADGGILALGANIFNMAVIGVFITYIISRYTIMGFDPKKSRLRYYGGGFLGAFLSVIGAAIFAAIELGIPIVNSEPVIPLSLSLPLIVFYHLLIGFGEGLITVGIIHYLNAIEFDSLLEMKTPATNLEIVKIRSRDKALIGVTAIISFLILLSPFADSNPDGLESVAEHYGVPEGSAWDFGFLTDYGSDISFLYGLIPNPVLTTLISAIIGIAVVLIIFLGLWYFIHQRSRRTQQNYSEFSIDTVPARSQTQTYIPELDSSQQRWGQIDVRSKIIATFVVVVSCSLLVELTQVLWFISIFLLFVLLFRPKKTFLLHILGVLPIIGSLTILAFLSFSKSPIVYRGLLYVTVHDNVSFALFSGFRSLLIALFILILIASEESFFEIVYGLDDLKVPTLITSLTFFIYRYFFLLKEELERTLEARSNRLYGEKLHMNLSSLKLIGNIIGGLLARSFQRAGNIAETLSARGFTGELIHPHRPWTVKGFTFLSVIVILVIVILFVGQISPIAILEGILWKQ
ncbi:MAG: energy-coupling factor ABC transporter permease [Candidatus Hermodarchaeota archaeon]